MTLFEEACLTKDAQELTTILDVAAKTNATLQATWILFRGTARMAIPC